MAPVLDDRRLRGAANLGKDPNGYREALVFLAERR